MYATKTTLLTLMATITTTLALPTAPIVKRVAPNTQSCTATDQGLLLANYSVDIGVAYQDGIGCNNVFNSLQSLWISNWQCVDDGNGGTQLWFNAPTGNGAGINSALVSMYPNVQGGFNCPDN